MELKFTANKSIHRRVDGQDGVSISSISYGASSSSTSEPSSWSGTVPTLSKGDWLWVKTTYSNGSVQYTKSYIGTDGEDGTSVYVQSVVKVDKTTTVTMIDGDGQTSTLTIVDGDDGDQGVAGLNGYVHIAWANSSDGSVDFSTSVSENKQYMGTYTDNTSTDSQTPSDYSWTKIKGETGASGADGADGATIYTVEYGKSSSSSTEPSDWGDSVPALSQGDWLWTKITYSDNTVQYTKSYMGTDGDDGDSVYIQSATKVGKTTTVVLVNDEGTETTLTIADGEDGNNGTNGLNGYVHIAWANSADGSVDFSTSVSANKQYLGTYTDNTATDSQTYSDYSWSKIKGENGADGSDGSDGSDGEDAKVFDFKISSQTYTTNLRYSGKQQIQLTSVVQGYTGVVVYWSTTGGSFNSSSTVTTTFDTNPTLYIPYTNTGEITITLEDDSSGSTIQPVSKKISSVNATEYNHFFGLATSESSIASYTDSSGNTCSPINGDYFIWGGTTGTYTKGVTYEYNSSANPVWQALLKNEINGAQKLLNALNVIKQSGQDLSALNDPNTTSWLTDVIVDTLIANKLFAQAITIMTGGHIKGGTRYNDSGETTDWSKKGFWLGANGALKALLLSDEYSNTIVGTDAMSDSGYAGSNNFNNTAIGENALFGAYRTYNNTAVGKGALYNMGSGSSAQSVGQNVAVGVNALYSAYGTTGYGKGNVALGYQALYSVTGGSFNIGIGNGVGVYKNTGRYQMNFNNAIIHLEFNASRKASEIFNVLKTYFPSATYSSSVNVSVGAIGKIDNKGITYINAQFYYSGQQSSIIIYAGSSSYSLTASDTSTTFTGRTIITFANPNITDTDRDSTDCLT